MENTLSVPMDDVEAFEEAMASLEGTKQENARPKIIRLNGETGAFVEKAYDAQLKKQVDKPFAAFDGVIIRCHYFAQWKFNSTPKDIKIRTREFADFSYDQVELLKIDYSKPEAERTTTLEKYTNYGFFKEAQKTVDKITGKESTPFDLWVSQYIYIPSQKVIVNYRFKGETRSSHFDFLNTYRDRLKVNKLIRALVRFGSGAKTMAKSDSGESKVYYYGTFEALEPTSNELRKEVAAVGMELDKWINSYKEKEPTVEIEAPTTQSLPPAKEENYSDIPF